MTITVTRIVLLGPALSAAAALIDKDHRDEAFTRFFNEPHPITGKALFHSITLKADEAMRVIPTAPDTAMGRAWSTKAAQSLRATLADEIRPFDLVDLDDHPSIVALSDLAEQIENYSPLLAPVADTLNLMTAPESRTIGGYLLMAERVTDQGLNVAQPASCTKHDECLDVDPVIVPWRHIRAIMPGVCTDIRHHVDRLLAELPVPAENDNGAARGN